MKYGTCFGGLWRMTNTNFRRYPPQVAAGYDVKLDSFGKFLGEVLPGTDITTEEAENAVEELDDK